jgi:hypothetical protein
MKGRRSHRRILALYLGVGLAVSCASDGHPSLSAHCQEVFAAFDAAKSKWEAAKGTPIEDALKADFNEVQDRLFQSGCLHS